MYKKTSKYMLSEYCDANYAGDRLERKSTSMNYQFLGGNLISWARKRQSTISFSTVEAEYILASLCSTQMLYMKNQLEDFQIYEKPHNSETNTSSPPLQKFDLTTITLPVSEALLFNEPISPLLSTPSSPPYYDLSSDSEQPKVPDPSSPTLAQLQATTNSEKSTSVPETSEPIPSPSTPPSTASKTLPSFEPPNEPSETSQIPSKPIHPTSEPEPTFSTLEEVFAIFSESSTARLRQLSEESRLSDNPSKVRTHWNGFLRWMTFEVFKLKGVSEQVRNDYIRGDEERLEARLAQEDEEKARKEVEEKAATKAATVEAEAKARADTEEATHIVAEEATKTTKVALTRGESSTFDIASLHRYGGQFQLGVMDLDMTLIIDEKPASITEDSTEDEMSFFEAWERSNRLSLNLMRMTMAENVKSSIPNTENARELMKSVK
ncbi:uncharacterized protein LOC127081940 [Lathyrus oleraceus]|uniref:uncharacterized protein LOC127081940 n=1 Tax=Pisum sativum TaxID=3888 RepID=UPI0021D1F2D9|nr:uncharacterized protein LOC127081940 [Pisum sativum]